jgi:phage shock protein A
MDEIEEATQTLSPQQLQVKSLADKAKQATEQKKQLLARQAMEKAQEKMHDANKAVTSS